MIDLQLYKKLDNFDLDINLQINKNQFIALLGHNGSGKSTLLKIIAGLIKSDSKIIVNGKVWQDKNIFLPPQQRDIGFVFQDLALFEHMSVLKNLLYVNNNKQEAMRLLDIANLTHLKDKYPKHLSGGERQKLALIRAFINKPDILLMDEPLSAIDYEYKQKLLKEIKQIHNQFNTTTIYVTHSFKEAYFLANRIITIQKGKIIDDNTQFIKYDGKIIDKDEQYLSILIDNKVYKIKVDDDLHIR